MTTRPIVNSDGRKVFVQRSAMAPEHLWLRVDDTEADEMTAIYLTEEEARKVRDAIDGFLRSSAGPAKEGA